MASDWLFCIAIDAPNLLFPDPLCIGAFELTRKPEPAPAHENALTDSAAAFALALPADVIRARCTLQGVESHEALRTGRIHAREMVEMLPMLVSLPIAVDLLNAAFVSDMRSTRVVPMTPSLRDRRRRVGGIVAMMDEMAQQPRLMIDAVLLSGRETGELGAVLRRSTHWQALARDADDDADALLAMWMACETLSRSDPDEVLTAKWLSTLGMPRNQMLFSLPPPHRAAVLASLAKDRVRGWAQLLAKLFERLREARNAIAHSGYRGIEMPSFFTRDEIHTVRLAMELLIPRLQHLIVNALRIGIVRPEDLWRRFGDAFSYRETPEDLVSDLEGTVLYLLENPPLSW